MSSEATAKKDSSMDKIISNKIEELLVSKRGAVCRNEVAENKV